MIVARIENDYLDKVLRSISPNGIPSYTSDYTTLLPALKEVRDRIPHKNNLTFLDLGCGAGNVLFAAKAIFQNKTMSFIGIDNKKDIIQTARKIDCKFNIVNADLLDSKTIELIGAADIIYCYQPMPDKEELNTLYKNAEAYMKPGAFLLVLDETERVFDKLEALTPYNKHSVTTYIKKID